MTTTKLTVLLITCTYYSPRKYVREYENHVFSTSEHSIMIMTNCSSWTVCDPPPLPVRQLMDCCQRGCGRRDEDVQKTMVADG